MSLNDTPSSAKKSAVIISQDGEIEQHILHEENPEKIVDGSVEKINDEVPPTVSEVVYVTTPEQEYETTEFASIPLRKLKRILVPIALLVLLLPLYLLFSPADNNATTIKGVSDTNNDSSQITSADPINPPPTKIESHPQSINQLKKVATIVLEDEQQITANIDLFVDNWNLMDDFSKQDFNNSFWMNRFKTLLTEKIDNFEMGTDKYSADHTINYRNSLINMAAVINSLDVIENTSSSESDIEFEKLFEKISSELAMAEMDKKLSGTQLLTTAETIEATGASELAIESATPVKTSTEGFTESDVNYLLGQYSTTYEFGSTQKIMRLFSARSGYKKALKRSFKKVFAYSSDRSIHFSNFEWQFLENSIIGHGNYDAKITLKQDKGIRHISANIKVRFRADEERLRIARMNFSKVKVRLEKPKSMERTPVNFIARQTKLKKVSSRTQTPATISNKLNNSEKMKASLANRDIKIPTAAELQDIVTRFIGAYEAGNINALDKIFSKHAKTNDQNGLPEIKKDYRVLFQSTTDRQLFIQDLKWTIVDNYARGKGVLNILIVTDGSRSIDSQHGEIQITAQKQDDKLLITHLFHDLRN